MVETRRPGAGRPKELEDEKRVTILMERGQLESLDDTAQRLGISRSEAARRAIAGWLSDNDDGN